jgi:hypothetical protein
MVRQEVIQQNLNVPLSHIHRSISVVSEEIIFKLCPPISTVFPYPSLCFRISEKNDELWFHCITIGEGAQITKFVENLQGRSCLHACGIIYI